MTSLEELFRQQFPARHKIRTLHHEFASSAPDALIRAARRLSAARWEINASEAVESTGMLWRMPADRRVSG
jgi:hypothetical protein